MPQTEAEVIFPVVLQEQFMVFQQHAAQSAEHGRVLCWSILRLNAN